MSGTSFIDDLITSTDSDTDKSTKSATNRGKVSSDGKLDGAAVNKNATFSMQALSSSPIALMGVDVANSVVTSVSQSLVSAVNKTVAGALKDVRSVTDTVFTAFALAATAEVEVIMELARGNAREIVKLINQKDQLIKELQDELNALFNAVTLLLNSQPYFTPYLKNLILAYQKITDADKQLKSVVSVLKLNKFYNDREFNRALTLLQDAQKLILPDSAVNVSEIRSTFLLEGANTINSDKKALAAAAAIPGISANIARKMVSYVGVTGNINLLLTLFSAAFGEFIAAYKRNDNIDKATLNHLQSAIDQIESLLQDMGVILFPTDGSNKSILYPASVTTSATVWGTKLFPIIEWLKFNPGQASKQLDLTGESVSRYKAAIVRLNSMGDRRVGLATLSVSAAHEDALATGRAAAKVLFSANTVLATSKDSGNNTKTQIKQFKDLLSAAQGLDNDIKNALSSFIQTPSNLLGGAAKIVSSLKSLASDLGMDRATDLLAKADLKNFFAMTPETATYIGAAVFGVREILKAVDKNPNATDQDRQKLEKVSDDFSRQNSVKKIEAARRSTNSTDLFVKQKKANADRIRQEGNTAIAVDQKYTDGAAQDISDVDKVHALVVKATGNRFGFL